MYQYFVDDDGEYIVTVIFVCCEVCYLSIRKSAINISGLRWWTDIFIPLL